MVSPAKKHQFIVDSGRFYHSIVDEDGHVGVDAIQTEAKLGNMQLNGASDACEGIFLILFFFRVVLPINHV